MAGPRVISFTQTENYSTRVFDGLKNLRTTSSYADFTISIDGHEEISIPCHRFMLALHSPVLSAMMSSDMAEAETQTVKLSAEYISPEILNLTLDYMYSGHIAFDENQLTEMMYACDYLQLAELKDMCEEEVLKIVDTSNATSWRKVGDQLNLDDIKNTCNHIIRHNLDEISEQQDFLKMTMNEVKDMFVDIREKAHDPEDVLYSSMHWISREEDNRLTHLADLIDEVQLDKCSCRCLLHFMETYESILTRDICDMLSETVKKSQEKQALIWIKLNVGYDIYNGTYSKIEGIECWQYVANGRLNEYKKLCETPIDVAWKPSVCKTLHGFVISGGTKSDHCFEYSIVTNSWKQLKNMRMWRVNHASICVGGVLYVIGGYSSEVKDASTTVDGLELDEGNWQQGPDPPIPVSHPNCKIAHINGSVYLLDIYGTKQLMHLDVKARRCTKRASLPVDEQDVICETTNMVSVNDKLLVAWIKRSTARLYLAQYSPEVDTWGINIQTITPYQNPPSYLICYSNTLLMKTPRNDKLEQFSLEEGIEAGSWSPSNISIPQHLETMECIPIV